MASEPVEIASGNDERRRGGSGGGGGNELFGVLGGETLSVPVLPEGLSRSYATSSSSDLDLVDKQRLVQELKDKLIALIYEVIEILTAMRDSLIAAQEGDTVTEQSSDTTTSDTFLLPENSEIAPVLENDENQNDISEVIEENIPMPEVEDVPMIDDIVEGESEEVSDIIEESDTSDDLETTSI